MPPSSRSRRGSSPECRNLIIQARSGLHATAPRRLPASR
jgi:hypothetical protein